MNQRKRVVVHVLSLLLVGSGAIAGPSEPVRLRLLKSTVVLYEPVYVEIIDPQASRSGEDSKRINDFESRRKGSVEWSACSGPYGLRSRSFNDPRSGVHEALGPVIVNRELLGPRCEINSIGEFEIRWRAGVPVTLAVQPVPKGEEKAAALVRDGATSFNPRFMGDLASSVYAGYFMLGFYPTLAQGPRFVRTDRLFEERSNTAKQRDYLVSEHSRSARAVEIYLKSHPDFIFADRARLLLADDLVFLGKCKAALQELTQVTGEEKSIAAKYIGELATVEEAKDICKD